MLAQEQPPLTACEVQSLVGMNHYHGLVFAQPDACKRALQRQESRHMVQSGPANPASRELIDYD
jgi:hypothetical protein